MKLTKQLETEIIDAYNDFWVANLSANMKLFSSYLTDDFSIFGSAAGEIFFSRKDAVAFYTATADELRDKAQLRNRNISLQPLNENNIVVRELSDLYVLIGDNWTFYGHARITCVLAKADEQWKAAHQHASFADHRTEEGQQLAIDKIEQENSDLREAVQRRTAELEAKNRELEIESAVERVRAQSMAMQQTEDITKVNQQLFTELSKLNIDGFTGVAIYFYDENDEGTVWDLSSPGSLSDPSSFAFKFDAKQAPLMGEFISICKNGEEDYFILDYPKEKLKVAVRELEIFAPEVAAAFKNAMDSGVLEHQWNASAKIMNGMLSLDLMKPPTEEVKSITLKMAAAFNLAYQRFHDLQKAESQARDAHVQLALERVRARTMAMHHSDELSETSSILFQQIKELGFETWSCGFCIRTKNNTVELWMGADSGELLSPMMIPYKEEETHRDIFEAFSEGKLSHEKIWEGKALQKHYAFLKTIPSVNAAIEQLYAAGLSLPDKQCYYVGFFKQGYLLLITKEPNDQLKELSRKFAQVFDLTYTRFLDLKNAEGQARESQIQLALERVRARTMAMQHSNELADASFVLDTQVRSLGIQTRGCAFNIYGEHESTEWFSSEMGTMPTYKTPHEDFFSRALEAGKNGQQIYIEEFAGENCKAHYEYLCTLPVLGDALRGMIAAGSSFPERQIDHATFFKYGYLLFITLEPAPEAHETFIRFAKVFEQTYTRFLDLQKAEAQTVRAEQNLLEIKAARKKAEDTLIELQAMQKQLVQSEKMASLGELTAGIAHEIQNPLNFVNNFSDVSNELMDEMTEELDKGDIEEVKAIAADIKSNLEKINHHGKRADAIVKGMLQHSRKSDGKKESTDINVLCDEYLRLSYHGLRAKDKSFNATLKTDYDQSIGKINIVPQDIGRVIMNLLTNAFYAVGLRLTTDNRPPTTGEQKPVTVPYKPTVSINTKKLTDKIEIKITDNGTGIPKEIIDKIFQPFFTTKPTGKATGLGLSLAYDIVKSHDGEFKVETTEGEGTTFIIQLPMA